ncbi:hypothetical protein BH10PAT4_BH10PAT4_2970 [soil metagenome]
MIRFLLIIPGLLIITIIGLSIYLQPNDLRDCSDQPSITLSCQAVDAIVAVSGGDTNERTDAAISLYKNSWAPMLIFSGAAQDKTGPSNAEVMKARAIEQGVPSSVILLDESSETTKQNAENTKTILQSRSIKSVILVTSGYHQRRASLEFNKRADNVTIKNSPVYEDQDWSFWWWTSPRGWSLATTELFKIILFNFGATQ